jgi:hypothetical protein
LLLVLQFSRDLNENETVMCQDCIDKLGISFEFIEKCKHLESDFFGPARKLKSVLKTFQAQTTTSIDANSNSVNRLKRKSDQDNQNLEVKVQILEGDDSGAMVKE